MNPNQVINACGGNNVTIVNGDAFPVSFSHLLDISTLSSDMFQVTLSNGDIIKPGKSALVVLFCHVLQCVQYEVSVIWLLHLSLVCLNLIVFTNHMY